MKTGWQSVKLADLADFGNGLWKGKKGPFKQVIVIRNTNFRADGRLSLQDAALLDVEVKQFNTRMLEFGDIIIEKSGGGPKQPVGRVVAFLEKEGSFSYSNFTSRIRVADKGRLEPSYLLKVLDWWYKSGRTVSMQRHSTGIRNLDFKTYQQQEVPLPPLEEQQAIVDKLDRAFAGLETARANAEANLENAKELFQSILDKVIGNAVESPEARPLQDVTLKIGSGATPKGGKAAYKTEGIALVRSMNVHDLRFKHEGLAYIDEQQAKALQNVEIRPDDVLINITGASIARCCIVDPDILQARVNQHVAILRPDPEQIESKYLELSLVSSTNKRRLLKDGDEAGATRQALTKAGLQAFKIGIPSLSVQRQVEEEVAILKVETDRLEEEYTRQLEDLDELKQSLLQKAFAGELT